MQTVVKHKIGFLEFLGLLCIFSVFLDKAIRGEFAFDFYFSYPIFLLFLITQLFVTGKLVMPPKWFMRGTFIIFASSLFILLVSGLLGFEFWKQVFGILFTSITYFNVLYVFKFNVQKIFHYYLVFAFYVALFGVIDNVLHISGIHITFAHMNNGFQYREYSIMGEPFFLALALTPAIAYYLTSFKKTWKEKKFRLIIIFLCYTVTYSSIAVTGFVLSVLLALYFNDYFNIRKNRLILAPFLIIPIVVIVNFAINNVQLINARFNDTSALFLSSELKTSEAGRSNASTFALYSNYIIARDSFLQDPLFGSGLGSHPLIYRETFLKYFPSVYLDRYGSQNQQDANSKFLRLMSETGLIGLFMFLLIFFKFFAPKKKMITPELRELGAINYSIFVYIFLCLVRNGNYINIGFFLFLFLYHLTWKIISNKSRLILNERMVRSKAF